MRCNNCGTDNNDNAKFCRGCGSPMDIVQTAPAGKTCPSCGGQNAIDAVFCRNCGSPLNEEIQNVNEMVQQGRNTIVDAFAKMTRMLKLTFIAPKDAISTGKADKTYWLATTMMTVIAGLILALITVLDYNASDPGWLEKLGRIVLSDSAESTPGGMSVFLLTWMAVILVVAAYIGIAFGIAKLFGSDCDLRNLAGAMFPAICIMMAGTMLGAVFFAGSTVSSIVCAFVIDGLFIIWSTAILRNVFEEFIPDNQTKQMYSFMITVALTLLTACVIMMIFEGTVLLPIEVDINEATGDAAGSSILEWFQNR